MLGQGVERADVDRLPVEGVLGHRLAQLDSPQRVAVATGRAGAAGADAIAQAAPDVVWRRLAQRHRHGKRHLGHRAEVAGHLGKPLDARRACGRPGQGRELRCSRFFKAVRHPRAGAAARFQEALGGQLLERLDGGAPRNLQRFGQHTSRRQCFAGLEVTPPDRRTQRLSQLAPQWAAAQQFPHHVYIRSWMNSQGYLYQDIQMVRTVMYVVMLMVVAVACFNIVSTLVMAVNEKRSEIAILKTMGASPGQIRLTFVIQGMVNGVAGALLGALLGGLLSSKLTQILGVIEKLIGHRFLNPDIYFIDFLPTELHMQDLVIVTSAAILMSLLATLYPAWRASGLVPSRELGH